MNSRFPLPVATRNSFARHRCCLKILKLNVTCERIFMRALRRMTMARAREKYVYLTTHPYRRWYASDQWRIQGGQIRPWPPHRNWQWSLAPPSGTERAMVVLRLTMAQLLIGIYCIFWNRFKGVEKGLTMFCQTNVHGVQIMFLWNHWTHLILIVYIIVYE